MILAAARVTTARQTCDLRARSQPATLPMVRD